MSDDTTKPPEFIEIPACTQSFRQRKKIHGVGTNDALYITRNETQTCPYYLTWKNMFMRCYSEIEQQRHPAYIGCTVSPVWHLFSNFRDWMECQDWEGKELDKDIVIPGNRIYSPEYCVFVTRELNLLLTDRGACRGLLPVGVDYHKASKRYRTRVSIKGKSIHVGSFKTPEEASKEYIKFKSAHVKKIALEQSDVRIRNGLLRHADIILKGDF